MNNYKETTANGYEIIALVQNKEVRSDGSHLYTMVAAKEKPYIGTEYVVGSNYDITDCTWGSGIYLTNQASAMEVLAEKITQINKSETLQRAIEFGYVIKRLEMEKNYGKAFEFLGDIEDLEKLFELAIADFDKASPVTEAYQYWCAWCEQICTKEWVESQADKF